MPRSPIRIEDHIGDRRQSLVDVSAVCGGRRLVDHGSDKRMPEDHMGGDCDQTVCFRVGNRLSRESKFCGCSPQQHGIPERLGSRDEKHQLSLSGQPLKALLETLFKPTGERQSNRPESARHCSRRHTARQLQDR
jgi:hypothetical protein